MFKLDEVPLKQPSTGSTPVRGWALRWPLDCEYNVLLLHYNNLSNSLKALYPAVGGTMTLRSAEVAASVIESAFILCNIVRSQRGHTIEERMAVRSFDPNLPMPRPRLPLVPPGAPARVRRQWPGIARRLAMQ